MVFVKLRMKKNNKPQTPWFCKCVAVQGWIRDSQDHRLLHIPFSFTNEFPINWSSFPHPFWSQSHLHEIIVYFTLTPVEIVQAKLMPHYLVQFLLLSHFSSLPYILIFVVISLLYPMLISFSSLVLYTPSCFPSSISILNTLFTSLKTNLTVSGVSLVSFFILVCSKKSDESNNSY